MTTEDAPDVHECACGEDIRRDDHGEWVHVETDSEWCYPGAISAGGAAFLMAEPVEWVES